jgi:two-component system sensor histidine kinase/response regulator
MAITDLKPMPLASPSDTISEPPVAVAAPAGKLTLLIVDDEEGPRQSLRIVFKHEYNVVLACNAAEAIEKAGGQEIHVAVLDIMMQGLSGVELLRELKETNPTIQVVMLTAYETLETARQALRYGASDYLNKPFDISSMRAAVAGAAQKHLAAARFANTHGELESLQLEIRDQRVREQMARTKGDIYASVLHDINSPLTVISGFIELINRSMMQSEVVEGAQLESLKIDLKNVMSQVDRCFEISRRYLSFLNGGRSEPSSSTSVRQILADVQDLLIRHPSAQGHQLVVRDLESDILAAINGTDLLQILLNLTINAFHSTDEPHRVTLEASRLEAPLELEQFRDGPTERFLNRDGFLNEVPLVAIIVRDNGPGIAPEHVRRMFEEQFTTKAADRGTGLGLSIVRRLLVNAHGAIHLQTAFGHGSEFTILLRAS